jgi:hypothetical protein
LTRFLVKNFERENELEGFTRTELFNKDLLLFKHGCCFPEDNVIAIKTIVTDLMPETLKITRYVHCYS